MILEKWEERPITIQHLYNPCFCALIIHTCLRAYQRKRGFGMPIDLAFLIIPIIFSEDAIKDLKNIKEEEVVSEKWIDKLPIFKHIKLTDAIQSFADISRESLLFAHLHNLIQINNEGSINFIEKNYIKDINLNNYFLAAEKLGKWLANYQDSCTIYIMFGIKP